MPVANRSAQTAGSVSCGASSELEPAEAERAAEDEQHPRPPDGSEDQRPAEGAAAEDRGDQPERLRALVERQPGDERQEHVEVERERADEEHGEERDGDPPRADGEPSASPTPASTPARAPARGGRGPSRMARSAQIATRVAHRVQPEGDSRPGAGDDQPAERGADDARRRPQARAERHGVREVVPPDDLEHERVPRGRVEGERDALDEAEDVQLPHGDDPRQRQDAEHGRLQREHRLHGDDHPPEVDPVRDRAADERERRDRAASAPAPARRPRPASRSARGRASRRRSAASTSR